MQQARTFSTRLSFIVSVISFSLLVLAQKALSRDTSLPSFLPGVHPGAEAENGQQVQPRTPGRGLQAEDSPELYALVATAAELLRAVQQGTPHIRITAHIDLTRDAVAPLDFQIRILSSIKSITGSCAQPPVLQDFNLAPNPPLLPLERGQCLLVTQSGFIKSASGPLWLDNLYLRRELPPGPGGATEVVARGNGLDGGEGEDKEAARPPLVVTDRPEGLLWATKVVFQSDGGGAAVGAEVFSAAYFDECTFAHFGAASMPVVLHGGSATASLERCTFFGNTGLPPDGESAFNVDGLIRLRGSSGGHVRLERCELVNNAVDYVAVDESTVASGSIFSDVSEMGMWRAATGEVLFARPLEEAESIGFVDDEWRWFPLTVEEAGAWHLARHMGCLVLASGILAVLFADLLAL